MAIPKVNKCCCFTTETGTIIIGVLTLLGCVSNLATCITYLSNPHRHDKSDNNAETNPLQAISGFNSDGTAAATLVYVLLDIVIVCMLLYGVFKRVPVLMLPCLILNGIGICFGLAALAIGGIFILTLSVAYGLLFILIVGLFMSLFIYMWIVVYSHYCVLKEENARGQYDKQVCRS